MLPQLTDALKKAGYSLTKPRLTVFGALQSPKPRTMRELTKELEGVIDRASVYRTVALFEKVGIVNRIQHGWKYKLELSDAFSPHHHHLTCVRCSRVISFDEPQGFDALLASIGVQNGFVISNHILEIQGTCKDCQALSEAAA